MAQSGPADYANPQPPVAEPQHIEGVMDEPTDVGARAQTLTGELASSLRERPYITLATAACLAFVVGAVWKLSHGRPQSSLEALRARLPDVRGHLPDLRRWKRGDR
jgi:hypothetical protein